MATSRPITFRQGHVPFHINDENRNSVKKQTVVESGKTPVNNTKRRAFGDISNRKLDRNQNTTGKANIKVNNDSTVKSISHLRKKNIVAHAKNESGAKLQSKTNVKRRVNFILPPEQSTTTTSDVQEKGKQDSFVAQNDVNQTDFDNSFEIEQAAGRTWDQQHANGDHDSSISDCSLEGVETLHEDHMKLREILFYNRQQDKEAEIEEERRGYEEMKLRWNNFTFKAGKKYGSWCNTLISYRQS
jgi:hypothetical protein